MKTMTTKKEEETLNEGTEQGPKNQIGVTPQNHKWEIEETGKGRKWTLMEDPGKWLVGLPENQPTICANCLIVSLCALKYHLNDLNNIHKPYKKWSWTNVVHLSRATTSTSGNWIFDYQHIHNPIVSKLQDLTHVQWFYTDLGNVWPSWQFGFKVLIVMKWTPSSILHSYNDFTLGNVRPWGSYSYEMNSKLHLTQLQWFYTRECSTLRFL